MLRHSLRNYDIISHNLMKGGGKGNEEIHHQVQYEARQLCCCSGGHDDSIHS